MQKITPYDLWLDFKAWVNTQQGGFMPPQSVFIRVANIASIKLWEKWTKEAEKSQEIKDNLFPFLKSKNIITQKSNSYYSIAPPPNDYARYASCKILVVDENKTVPSKEVNNGKCLKDNKLVTFKSDEDLAKDYYDSVREQEVEMIDNQRWSAALKHLTKKPSFNKPKITQIDGTFKVAPKDVGVLVLNYYIEPIDAIFAYKTVAGNLQTGSGGAIQYDANNSRNFQWNITVKNELLEMVKDVYIGFTRDGGFAQISNSQKQ